MSLRDIILAAPDLKREPAEVPEWVDAEGNPVVVLIATMSGTEHAAWSDEAFGDDGKILQTNLRSRLLVRCLVDESGAPIFTPADVEALEGKSDVVLTRLFKLAKKLNGMNADAVDDAVKK